MSGSISKWWEGIKELKDDIECYVSNPDLDANVLDA